MVASPLSDAIGNLPVALTSLVGRERDTELITGLLSRPDVNLLTLTGPAGVGKTRLAVRVSAEIEAAFPDGVTFVDLSATTDPALVLPNIASELGLDVISAIPTVDLLVETIGAQTRLLVLDNLEQVVSAAAALNELLALCPRVKILATSRVALRVQGEQEFAVQPLDLPTSREQRSDPMDCSAVALFVQRARAVRPDFALTESNTDAVIEICRHLDGLPLAIELAAARSKVLSPQALLTRLTQPLQLLTGGARDAPDRHQTMREAIAWSFGLLTDEERTLFERLGVFASGFTLSAAEAVAGTPSPTDDISADRGIGSYAVLDALAGLADHSLLVRIESQEEEPRFRMLEIVREFALDRLEACGDAELARNLHARFFHDLAEAAWETFGLPAQQRIWLDRLETDHENIRAALTWLEEHDPAGALAMAGALCWYWYIRGHRVEGERWLYRGLADPNTRDAPTAVRARALLAAGILAQFQDKVDEAESYLNEALTLWRREDDNWGIAFSQLVLGVMAEDTGDYDEAYERFQEARDRFRKTADDASRYSSEYHLGVVAFGKGDLDAAERHAQLVLAPPRESWSRSACYTLHLLGLIALERGDLDSAASWLRENHAFALQLRMPSSITESHAAIAIFAAAKGDYERAARLFGSAEANTRALGTSFALPERNVYLRGAETIRTALGEARYAEMHREGWNLGEEASIALATNLLTVDCVEKPAQPVPVQPASAQSAPLRGIEARPVAHGLTKRELDVLRLVAMGMSDREIAEALFISYGTARTHVRNILDKLDVSSRAAATSYALRNHIV